MTLFEAASGCLCVVLCIVGGVLGFSYFGLPGGVLGAMAGFVGYLGFVGLLFGLVYLVDVVSPPRPLCRNGICRSGDYELLDLEGETRPAFYRCRCRCGTTYARQGDRFLEQSVDGHLRAFMKRTPWGRWVRDDL